MKKINDYLIHLLGGRTIEESMTTEEAMHKVYEEVEKKKNDWYMAGQVLVISNHYFYAKKLKGMEKQKWIDKVWGYIEADYKVLLTPSPKE